MWDICDCTRDRATAGDPGVCALVGHDALGHASGGLVMASGTFGTWAGHGTLDGRARRSSGGGGRRRVSVGLVAPHHCRCNAALSCRSGLVPESPTLDRARCGHRGCSRHGRIRLAACSANCVTRERAMAIRKQSAAPRQEAAPAAAPQRLPAGAKLRGAAVMLGPPQFRTCSSSAERQRFSSEGLIHLPFSARPCRGCTCCSSDAHVPWTPCQAVLAPSGGRANRPRVATATTPTIIQ